MDGQFYSMVALIITIPIIMFVVSYISYSQKFGGHVADRVISDQLHQLTTSVELDTAKAMEICGRRAVLAAANFVLGGGIPLTDADANLTTLMLAGMINRTASFMMINNTMPNWSQRITSKPVNFDIYLQYGNISIENYDGFSLRIGMDINLTVTDKLGVSRLDRVNSREYVIISIAGIEDPVFPLKTQGFLRRIIRRADQPYFGMRILTATVNSSGSCSARITFNKSECDTSKILVASNLTGVVYSCYAGIILGASYNLSGQSDCYLTGNASAVQLVNDTIVSSGYDTVLIDRETRSAWSLPGAANLSERYYYNGNGPDFLMRLEGNYSPTAKGIVTFAYPPELEEQALPVDNYSRVDYQYFTGQGACITFRAMPEWFGMDGSHAADLNISALLTGNPCTSG